MLHFWSPLSSPHPHHSTQLYLIRIMQFAWATLTGQTIAKKVVVVVLPKVVTWPTVCIMWGAGEGDREGKRRERKGTPIGGCLMGGKRGVIFTRFCLLCFLLVPSCRFHSSYVNSLSDFLWGRWEYTQSWVGARRKKPVEHWGVKEESSGAGPLDQPSGWEREKHTSNRTH
jgi:hypothetical protein